MLSESVSEAELQAYIDDQLEPTHRLEVADHLVRHPDLAARVLADLRANDAIRALAAAHAAEPGQRVVAASARLEGALRRGWITARMRWLAASAAALMLAGTALSVSSIVPLGLSQPAHAAMPVYVEEALMSHRTALVRRRMRSQPEIPHFDASDVRAATRIAVPRLPATWRILDVQIFPSDLGPSVQIVIDAGQKQPLSLFAARGTAIGALRPIARAVEDEQIAYWSREGVVYVLTGATAPSFLTRAANDLADNQDA